MRRIGLGLACLVAAIALVAIPHLAQEVPAGPALNRTVQGPATAPTYSDVYCAGFVTARQVPNDTYLITGEESANKIVFADRDFVYLNKGSAEGVGIGQEFSIVRAVRDATKLPWFKYQRGLSAAMGTVYADLGRVKVVIVHERTSTAEVVFACMPMNRGDLALPFEPRPIPPFKSAAAFDRFAPKSGKHEAMIVLARDFQQGVAAGSVVYVNAGSNQGIKVGEYFRFFRYATEDTYKSYGFGAAPKAYSWKDVPREVLGEGIVLHTEENASSVLITTSLRELFLGEYAELE